MMKLYRTPAFTLIELLVVVAIIGLLASILLPSLQGAREQGKRAVCLSNLRSIGQSSNAYSTEEKKEHAIPIHQNMVSDQLGDGFSGSRNFAYRTGMPFSYGGRTAQANFPTDTGVVQIMTNEKKRWAARTRPLNRYVYHGVDTSDSVNMPIYHCPSDTGYPGAPFSLFIYDAPADACADIPCYNMLGNSYHMNFNGTFYPAGSTSSNGEISTGPYGHRISSLVNTGRLALYMEPLFYTMAIQAAVSGSIPNELLLRGWHKAIMTSNVAFVDGSARTTKAMDLDDFDAATLDHMNLCAAAHANPNWYMRRGHSWQMDCYPVPGAWIPKYNPSGVPLVPDSAVGPSLGAPGWPATGIQTNMSPPGY